MRENGVEIMNLGSVFGGVGGFKDMWMYKVMIILGLVVRR